MKTKIDPDLLYLIIIAISIITIWCGMAKLVVKHVNPTTIEDRGVGVFSGPEGQGILEFWE